MKGRLTAKKILTLKIVLDCTLGFCGAFRGAIGASAPTTQSPQWTKVHKECTKERAKIISYGGRTHM